MGNVLRILKRDILRLLKVPPAVVVILALLVLPSIYTWYNVIGFWDPYDNTGHLRVAVVDRDQGAESELTGEICVGERIAEELKANDKLDWQLMAYDEAMNQLSKGDVYAVFVIPSDFTKDLLTITTGEFVKPAIDYYVNEKSGPVAPKITDAGATTLDETVNSAFVETVSKAAVDAIDEAITQAEMETEGAKSQALLNIEAALDGLEDTRTVLGDLEGAASQMTAKSAEARSTLAGAASAVDDASAALSGIAESASSLQGDLSALAAKAMPASAEAIAAISQTSARAARTAGELAGAAAVAQGDVSAALGDARSIVSSNESVIASLEAMVDSMPETVAGREELSQVITGLNNTNERAKTTISGLEQANETAKAITTDALADMEAIDEAVQDATANASDYASTLFSDVIPALERTLSSLASATSAASVNILGQKLVLSQAGTLLDDIDGTLEVCQEALGQTDELILGVQDGLETVRVDIISLGQADVLVKLLGSENASGLDAGRIADFIGQPTTLRTEQLYELNAYGGAMAPLFMNLTFWIGAFMLMVIMRQEVDGKGLENLTLTQRYLGRFSLFAIMVTLQALICCIGLPIIGVEVQSMVALCLAAVIASLSYLSIIYALSVCLQYIGKGICIVLVFIQIPAATGLYPIEMTEPFFQAVFPLFPFTYGINAMREAICGFYETHYGTDIATLILFFALFMALGILVRPLLSNVNRMAARQIERSGIYNGENVEVPVRRFRFSQVVRALTDRAEYREALERRYARFNDLYPKLIRGCIIIGIAVPVIFTVVISLNMNEKIVVLAAWSIWLILVFLFLIAIESLRASIERQMRLDTMSEEEIRSMYLDRNAMEKVAGLSGSSSSVAEVAKTNERIEGPRSYREGSDGEDGEAHA